jgi:hypothetical protein
MTPDQVVTAWFRSMLFEDEVLGPIAQSLSDEFFKALPACLVGMEACATAHYWARELKEAWPPGTADASEGCEGLRQAQQE